MKKFAILVVSVLLSATANAAYTGGDTEIQAYLNKVDCSAKGDMVGRCGTVHGDDSTVFNECITAVNATCRGGKKDVWCAFLGKDVPKKDFSDSTCKCPDGTEVEPVPVTPNKPQCVCAGNTSVAVVSPETASKCIECPKGSEPEGGKCVCRGSSKLVAEDGVCPVFSVYEQTWVEPGKEQSCPEPSVSTLMVDVENPAVCICPDTREKIQSPALCPLWSPWFQCGVDPASEAGKTLEDNDGCPEGTQLLDPNLHPKIPGFCVCPDSETAVVYPNRGAICKEIPVPEPSFWDYLAGIASALALMILVGVAIGVANSRRNKSKSSSGLRRGRPPGGEDRTSVDAFPPAESE